MIPKSDIKDFKQLLNDNSPDSKFHQQEHDSKSRLEITRLFLKSYFYLIAGGFIFCLVYNYGAALINSYSKLDIPIRYVDVTNTVSIITTTLSGGMGFVIGFYFKNKD